MTPPPIPQDHVPDLTSECWYCFDKSAHLYPMGEYKVCSGCLVEQRREADE